MQVGPGCGTVATRLVKHVLRGFITAPRLQEPCCFIHWLEIEDGARCFFPEDGGVW